MQIENTFTGLLYYLLIFSVLVQALLIPVNHGIIVADKMIPRVNVPQGIDDPGKSKIAWLVWEGKESITFLVWDVQSDSQPKRSLATLLRKDVKAVDITGSDHCYRALCTVEGQKAVIEQFLRQRAGVPFVPKPDHLTAIKSTQRTGRP